MGKSLLEKKIKGSCFKKNNGREDLKQRKRYHRESCDFTRFLVHFWVKYRSNWH